MAEFGFCKVKYGSSARHDWKRTNFAQSRVIDEENKAREEEERKKKEEERLRQEEREKEEEEERQRQERARSMGPTSPWWTKHSGGCTDLHMGETTPPPEDFMPIYDAKTNSYTFNEYEYKGPTRSTYENTQKTSLDVVKQRGKSLESDFKMPEDSNMASTCEEFSKAKSSKNFSKKQDIPKVSKKGGIKKSKAVSEESKPVRRSSIFKSMDNVDEPKISCNFVAHFDFLPICCSYATFIQIFG